MTKKVGARVLLRYANIGYIFKHRKKTWTNIGVKGECYDPSTTKSVHIHVVPRSKADHNSITRGQYSKGLIFNVLM